ncbi:hypothetical protein HPB51_019020 [Rhipicephalus microplus]|uniref:Carboxypeptidase regulatory-like domain-containing protein n=1 Tax=Rhipicephalus microplus TaxID=6941 RepID=A0A9J6D6N3_RHIMP|nr:hypothetical protein HPB51_019020 [Rhipicephalus microplus]
MWLHGTLTCCTLHLHHSVPLLLPPPCSALQASKDGYVLRPLDKLGHFEAFKYAEVKVTVSESSGQPLSGVLVSLSGAADYRNHSRTREDGRLRFPNLSPGNYFLRPMMKEYRFSPASKMLTVGEGATVELDIT